MSDKYKTKDTEKAYFVTLTVVGWIDLFTRKELKAIVVESLKYCQKNKGLILYGWCLMSSHLHMVCHTKDGIELSDILRDFKKFTSKKIVHFIGEGIESRREWLLDYFSKACAHLKKRPALQNMAGWQSGKNDFYTSFFLGEIRLYSLLSCRR